MFIDCLGKKELKISRLFVWPNFHLSYIIMCRMNIGKRTYHACLKSGLKGYACTCFLRLQVTHVFIDFIDENFTKSNENTMKVFQVGLLLLLLVFFSFLFFFIYCFPKERFSFWSTYFLSQVPIMEWWSDKNSNREKAEKMLVLTFLLQNWVIIEFGCSYIFLYKLA